MFGYNFTSLFINLMIFIGILFISYQLVSYQKNKQSGLYAVGTTAILVFLTYLPHNIGYIVNLVLLFGMFTSRKDKTLVIPGGAFIVSFILSLFINFIVKRAIIPITIPQTASAFAIVLGLAFILIVVLLVRAGIITNYFAPRFSGLITEWIPEGFSIKYEEALQKPLFNVTGQDGDKWVNVFFGNATVSINLQTHAVKHSYPTNPRGIKLLVKNGNDILLNINY